MKMILPENYKMIADLIGKYICRFISRNTFTVRSFIVTVREATDNYQTDVVIYRVSFNYDHEYYTRNELLVMLVQIRKYFDVYVDFILNGESYTQLPFVRRPYTHYHYVVHQDKQTTIFDFVDGWTRKILET